MAGHLPTGTVDPYVRNQSILLLFIIMVAKSPGQAAQLLSKCLLPRGGGPRRGCPRSHKFVPSKYILYAILAVATLSHGYMIYAMRSTGVPHTAIK